MSQRKLNKTDGNSYVVKEEKEAIKEIGKLSKIPNFSSSFDTFKKALPVAFAEVDFWRTHKIFRVANLQCECDHAFIIKKVRIAGGYGNDKLRVVFIVNGKCISIIEVYTKDEKEIEDKNRICRYCKGLDSP